VTSLSTSDGAHAIWPGVPDDLGGAIRLFDSAGWRIDHATDDLTQDLTAYLTPAGAFDVSAAAGITFAVEAVTDEILDFERAEFPRWLLHYANSAYDTIVGRDPDSAVVSAALPDGPGIHSPSRP